MNTDKEYISIIRNIYKNGDELETRNYRVKSIINCDQIVFTETPIVTIRKVAWKKAIKEMSWFLSGNPECPEELRDWWDGQLNEHGLYLGGYGEQLRYSGHCLSQKSTYNFDQIKFLLEGLCGHQSSRRLLATTWNPRDMAHVTRINHNEKTPTTCHGTLIHCSVRNKKLHITQYQRSADILLGVPHNWCQHWALLLYLSHWSELEVGSLRWIFGDVHLYQEESHIECAKQILSIPCQTLDSACKLCYHPTVSWTGDIPEFRASDFTMVGTVPDPIVTIRPKLL